MRHDDNVLFRPVVQLAQGVLAAGDDGFLGGEVLGARWGCLVGEDGVDLGEVDFGEEGADFFDGGAGVAGFCGGFCVRVSVTGGGTERAGGTLPAGVGDDGDALVDETLKGKHGGLEGADHGADDDEADVQLLGDAAHDVLSQIATLSPAELGELGVVDLVVLW